MSKITVLGAGLAGVEAAFHAAKRGHEVDLYDMKPKEKSPAHHSEGFAELVCSNSLRGMRPENASGILKIELALLDSFVLSMAKAHKVPAGSALAVDREAFSEAVTAQILAHPKIHFISQKVTSLDAFEGPLIVATGPLTDGPLFDDIAQKLGQDKLSFFDAAAPLIESDSIDRSIAFVQDRYGKGSGDYLNCPMDKAQYERFYEALLDAECADIHDFEKSLLFDGCKPVESIAKEGPETMRFGPLKPVGLTCPDGSAPYAVVQLRQDNMAASLYNMVGFQTRLKFKEQARVFRLIPGLEGASFARYGVMHRNSFLNGPSVLKPGFQAKINPNWYFAGQISGVEGYLESAASGLCASLLLCNRLEGKKTPPAWFNRKTVMGALAHYVALASPKDYQPMKANGGLYVEMNKEEMKQYRQMDPEKGRGRRARRRAYGFRALSQYGLSQEACAAAFQEASQ